MVQPFQNVLSLVSKIWKPGEQIAYFVKRGRIDDSNAEELLPYLEFNALLIFIASV